MPFGTDSKSASPSERLARPIQYYPGVGPSRAKVLARIGLHTVSDVLFLFPRDYRDLSDERSIDELEENALQSVRGNVEDIELRNTGTGRCILGVLIRQGDEYLRGIWFNQAYLRDKFSVGQPVVFSGKPRFRSGRWEMNHPRVTHLDDLQQDPSETLLPVYPLTEGLSQTGLRRIVTNVVTEHAELVDDVFSPAHRAQYHLLPIVEALRQIHTPESAERLEQARRRFVFQELFVLQLALAVRRAQQREASRAPILEATAKIDARIRRLYPFDLTPGQQQAIGEIAADMGRSWPMNRLLQGDVGSGKTVPAVYAMLLCVAHGHQAVLMAPTEVLARQHAQTFNNYLSAARVRRALLTGGTSTRERQSTLREIAAGNIDLIIGTQAVLQEDVQFAKLGLVVIDEQHKFGVRQRASLRQAGADPHYLVMTATPIPRSVSMTWFGDLELSTLRDAPSGRQPVHTYLVEPNRHPQWWEFVRKKLAEGRQGYVVTPLVDEAEGTDVANVQEAFEALANGELEAFRLGLIHGRMTSNEKEQAMQDFRSGETQVLVSTSVIEVGVDVPNATTMTIQGAQRFGLAQLHQLRGRIGRGQHPGFCGVVADTSTPEALERLGAFIRTNDGFELAEIDFQLRGPGDLMGTKQHGLPPFRIANLQRDEKLLLEARREAQHLIDSDSGLREPEHARLRRMVLARYGQALELGDTG